MEVSGRVRAGLLEWICSSLFNLVRSSRFEPETMVQRDPRNAIPSRAGHCSSHQRALKGNCVIKSDLYVEGSLNSALVTA